MENIGIRRKSLDQLLEHELALRGREEQQVEVTYEMGEGSLESGQSRLKAIKNEQTHACDEVPLEDGRCNTESITGSVQTEHQVTRGTFLLGVGASLASAGFVVLQTLQSSLFPETGLGLHSLSVLYGLAAFSCLYAPAVVRRLTPKRTVIVSFFLETLYTITFLHPQPYTLIPAAVLLGLSLGPQLCAQFTMVSQMVARMSCLTPGIRDKVQQRFLRIFCALVQSSRCWGNLLAALVIRHAGGAAVFSRGPPPARPESFCSDLQCQMTDDFVVIVPQQLTLLFSGVFTVCGVVGLLFGVLFSGPGPGLLPQDPLERSPFTLTLRQARLVLVDPHLRLAIPMLLYIGVEQGFVFADFTRLYVSCSLGLESVGRTMACLGGASALAGLGARPLAAQAPRPALLGAGLACASGLLLVLRLWTPDADDAAVFYVVAAGWGLCGGLWQALTTTYVATIYADDWQVPFCVYHLLQWAGMSFSYSVSRYLCTEVKIYVVAGCLLFAIIPYTLLEFRFHHRNYLRQRTADL